MPELPDVSVFKKYLDSTALHSKIADVEVADKGVLGEVGSRQLGKRLRGHELVSSRQHGKYLFVETNGPEWLLLHFGMTGFLKYFKKEEKSPPHGRVFFHFANGYTLGYDSQRKLGQVDLVDAPDDVIREKALGPDPIHSDFDLSDFRERACRKSGSVKSFLMDQEVMAGVGNVYSDETLFHAGIHPKTAVQKLDDETVKRLYRSMQKVLKTAIRCQVDVDRFPRDYLLPNREERKPCPRCSGTIRKVTVSGRSSYYCDGHQSAS
jgi:formamidopyrimidine-DNA glycosylase